MKFQFPSFDFGNTLSFHPHHRTEDVDLLREIEGFTVELIAIDKRTRKRGRTQHSREGFEAAVHAIVVNLLRLRPALLKRGVTLTIPLAATVQKATGRPTCYGTHFTDLVGNVTGQGGLLIQLGYVEVVSIGFKVPSSGLRNVTTIRPTDKFTRRFPFPANIKQSDVQPGPLVMVDGNASDSRYPELAREIMAINTARQSTAIRVDGEEFGTIVSNKDGRIRDVQGREVHRVFASSDLQQGGRLYGSAFWLTLPRDDRHRIRINGRPTCVVDFSAFNIHVAYLLAGHTPPSGDMYDIHPDWQREGVKRVVSALFMATKPFRHWPGTASLAWQELRACFPDGTRIAEVVEAIRHRHAAIADQLENGRGMFLQRIESDICVGALLRLIEMGLVALPLHDGLICRVEDAEIVAQTMREAAAKRIGPLPVAIKSHKSSLAPS